MSKLQQTLLPIKLEASQERLTSLAGLVVEELGQAKGIWERVDQLFARPGSGRGYKASEYVRPLVWLLHARRAAAGGRAGVGRGAGGVGAIRAEAVAVARRDWRLIAAAGRKPWRASVADRRRDDAGLSGIVGRRTNAGSGRDNH